MAIMESDIVFFNKVLEMATQLETKRETLKDSLGDTWSYRGLAKQTGINHRHLARVFKPKEFYTFLTLLDVIYPLGMTLTIPNSGVTPRPNKFDTLDTFKEETLKEISTFVKEQMANWQDKPLSQRGLGSQCGLAHTQVKGVIQGSKNYNVATLLKVLSVFNQTIVLEEIKK